MRGLYVRNETRAGSGRPPRRHGAARHALRRSSAAASWLSVGLEQRRFGWAPFLGRATALSLFAAFYFGGRERELANELARVREQSAGRPSNSPASTRPSRSSPAPTPRVTPSAKAPKPNGKVFVSPSQGVLLIASNLQPAPAGKAYEMWIIKGRQGEGRRSCSNPDPDGSAMHMQRGSAEHTDAVAVTLENRGRRRPTHLHSACSQRPDSRTPLVALAPLLCVPIMDSCRPAAQIPLSMLVVFASAKLLAEIFERLGQPGIVGEILAGVLIGPQVLGWLAPSEVLQHLSDLGVMFLLFRVGLEVKASELMKVGGTALLVAVAGVIVPFFAGWGICALWGEPRLESIFTGAAMVATSVGITAQVLAARGLLDMRASRIILAAAVIDDVLGLIVLAAGQRYGEGRGQLPGYRPDRAPSPSASRSSSRASARAPCAASCRACRPNLAWRRASSRWP